MNDERLDDALKACFRDRYEMDEHLKTQIKHKILEKQERRVNILLCLIQLAMCILTLFMIATAFIVNQRTSITLFLLGYAVIGNLVSVIVILLYNKNRSGRELL